MEANERVLRKKRHQIQREVLAEEEKRTGPSAVHV